MKMVYRSMFLKTKEMIVDFCRKRTVEPLTISGETIEQVNCFMFLGSISAGKIM